MIPRIPDPVFTRWPLLSLHTRPALTVDMITFSGFITLGRTLYNKFIDLDTQNLQSHNCSTDTTGTTILRKIITDSTEANLYYYSVYYINVRVMALTQIQKMHRNHSNRYTKTRTREKNATFTTLFRENLTDNGKWQWRLR